MFPAVGFPALPPQALLSHTAVAAGTHWHSPGQQQTPQPAARRSPEVLQSPSPCQAHLPLLQSVRSCQEKLRSPHGLLWVPPA